MDNILSIDLESWVHFYIDALKLAGQDAWTAQRRKSLDDNDLPKAARQLLDLLDRYQQKITFFVVAELAEWYPDVIEEIGKRGHEIGYHTHRHAVCRTSDILEKEMALSHAFLSKFHPIGFRAPIITITRESIARLKRFGFRYSSSSYDDHHIDRIEGVDEIPVSTLRWRGQAAGAVMFPKNLTLKLLLQKIPVGSGLFMALLGAKVSSFIRHLNKKDIPAVLFAHSWQLYPHSSIDNLSFRAKVLLRNPFCLPYTKNILQPFEELLKRHKFVSFKHYYSY